VGSVSGAVNVTTAEGITIAELVVYGGLQVVVIALTIYGIMRRHQQQEQDRQDRLYGAIKAGDEKARAAAHEQIEKVAEHVRSVEKRVGQVEKEVAAMPTREQLDTAFKDLRMVIEQHNQAMTERIDRMLEAREGGR
jgi:preprotein translocase subunit YajC